ncbi:MAG TPA: WG repeat-containing protein [Spirochaetota bacterium]|nr:WG repeat-containing protein [Spirochaetota bacterium]
MKKYITGLLIVLTLFHITETRASIMITTDMDAEIIEIVSPPEKKGSGDYCTLKIMVKKIHFVGGGHVTDQHNYDYLLNKTIEQPFKLKDKSVEKIIKKGNLIVVNLHHSSGPTENGFYSHDEWSILRESVDFTKHKPVLFKKNGYYGYRDYRGNILIGARLKDAREYLDTGIAAITDGYSWTYINYYGWPLLTAFVESNSPDEFREGLARYKDYNNLLGFMNRKGEAVIRAGYHHALPFSEGLAAVCTEYGVKTTGDDKWEIVEGGKWGFINKKGEMVIKSRFSKVSSFKKGKAVVYTLDNKMIVIDKKGRIVE